MALTEEVRVLVEKTTKEKLRQVAFLQRISVGEIIRTLIYKYLEDK